MSHQHIGLRYSFHVDCLVFFRHVINYITSVEYLFVVFLLLVMGVRLGIMALSSLVVPCPARQALPPQVRDSRPPDKECTTEEEGERRHEVLRASCAFVACAPLLVLISLLWWTGLGGKPGEERVVTWGMGEGSGTLTFPYTQPEIPLQNSQKYKSFFQVLQSTFFINMLVATLAPMVIFFFVCFQLCSNENSQFMRLCCAPLVLLLVL